MRRCWPCDGGPPTRFRAAKKKPLVDPDAALIERCGCCEGPIEAKGLFAEVALAPEFVEFLTLPAYEHLA